MSRLYLIPTPLSEQPIRNVIPEYNLEIILGIKHFIVEEIRTSRRFLRKAGYTGNFDDITFYELNEHTQPMEIQALISPLLNGQVTGRVKTKIKKFNPRKPDAEDGTWRMMQEDVDRVQEFRKCIECFLCQDVCHVLRDHHKHEEFIGPRFLVYTAALEMHPLDTEDRLAELKQSQGIGFCNITKCCTKVCPEHITITDNAIIPLKERVVDEYYDPLGWLWKKIRPQG